jgi:hypothetical protein
LGQPNETKPTVGAVGWEDLLTTLLYRECRFYLGIAIVFQCDPRSGPLGSQVLKSISAGSYAT